MITWYSQIDLEYNNLQIYYLAKNKEEINELLYTHAEHLFPNLEYISTCQFSIY